MRKQGSWWVRRGQAYLLFLRHVPIPLALVEIVGSLADQTPPGQHLWPRRRIFRCTGKLLLSM